VINQRNAMGIAYQLNHDGRPGARSLPPARIGARGHSRATASGPDLGQQAFRRPRLSSGCSRVCRMGTPERGTGIVPAFSRKMLWG
jgi:hypothetical protein